MRCQVRIRPESISRTEIRSDQHRILNEKSRLSIRVRPEPAALIAAPSQQCSIAPVKLQRTKLEPGIVIEGGQFDAGFHLMRHRTLRHGPREIFVPLPPVTASTFVGIEVTA